ncbi:hypothetical protein [Nonomuraea indica]|uniref:hypothetical protein n=1 Tax=Nonomuraea indica TaxID=1581193 RepID=UPI000C7D8139|nr:hypothetical protein [Nonomuraea indica]
MFKPVIRKLCVIAAATAGAVLPAVPAQADTWTGNQSRVADSAQSGNVFGDIAATHRAWGWSANVTNVNGTATTATHGGTVVTYIFH